MPKTVKLKYMGKKEVAKMKVWYDACTGNGQ
jgi:hypothetical protein